MHESLSINSTRNGNSMDQNNAGNNRAAQVTAMAFASKRGSASADAGAGIGTDAGKIVDTGANAGMGSTAAHFEREVEQASRHAGADVDADLLWLRRDASNFLHGSLTREHGSQNNQRHKRDHLQLLVALATAVCAALGGACAFLVRRARRQGRREGYSTVSDCDAAGKTAGQGSYGGGNAAAGFAELARLGAEAPGVVMDTAGGAGDIDNTSSGDDSCGSDGAEDEPRVFRAVDNGTIDDL